MEVMFEISLTTNWYIVANGAHNLNFPFLSQPAVEFRTRPWTASSSGFGRRQVRLMLFMTLGALGALLLTACEKGERFKPKYPESLTLSDSHIGAYSSKRTEDEKETAGTQFRTDSKWAFSKTEHGFRLVRSMDTMVARGYHKNSMPNELERKVALTLDFDSSLDLQNIQGYDTLHTVLKRIPQVKDEWRTQLLKLSDTVAMQKSMRDLWRMFKVFPKDEPLLPGQTLDPAQLNQKLETFTADTITFIGRNPRLNKVCLDAKIQYHREDSLVLLREQFLNSSNASRKLRNSTPSMADVQGTYVISVDKKTGLPCYWSLTEIGDMKLHDATTQQDQPIQLIRFEEDVVQY